MNILNVLGSIKNDFSNVEFQQRCWKHGIPLAYRGMGEINADFTDWHLQSHPEVQAAEKQSMERGRLSAGCARYGCPPPLLCCPDDQRCVRNCKAEKKLCRRCESVAVQALGRELFFASALQDASCLALPNCFLSDAHASARHIQTTKIQKRRWRRALRQHW